jgi:hypothetical protein
MHRLKSGRVRNTTWVIFHDLHRNDGSRWMMTRRTSTRNEQKKLRRLERLSQTSLNRSSLKHLEAQNDPKLLSLHQQRNTKPNRLTFNPWLSLLLENFHNECLSFELRSFVQFLHALNDISYMSNVLWTLGVFLWLERGNAERRLDESQTSDHC